MKNDLINVNLDKFHKQPYTERRTVASNLLQAFQLMLKAHLQNRADYTGLNDLVAYVKVKTDLEDAVAFWRREMQRAAWESQNKKRLSGAGRSPAVKAHGCAAVASLAGSLSDALNRSGNARKVAA